VKGSTRYYDDAAHIIRATCLKAMGRANHGPELPLSRSKVKGFKDAHTLYNYTFSVLYSSEIWNMYSLTLYPVPK
jgi:hypothetical protein